MLIVGQITNYFIQNEIQSKFRLSEKEFNKELITKVINALLENYN